MQRRRVSPGRDSGRISFVSLLMLVGIVAGVYFAIVFGPYYIDNFSLKQIMREKTNIAWRTPDDERLRKEILDESKNVGKHQETVEGHTQWVGGVGLLADNIFIVRDKETKKITIQVTYDRELELPILNRRHVIHFAPVVEGTLEQVTW